jgi:ACT domain-containing protein
MKAILTVIGQAKPGIIAGVATFLAQHNVNIEDISQTIMQDKFTMIMMVNLSACDVELQSLVASADQLGKQIGVAISIRHEDIFNAMHNV